MLFMRVVRRRLKLHSRKIAYPIRRHLKRGPGHCCGHISAMNEAREVVFKHWVHAGKVVLAKRLVDGFSWMSNI